MKGRLLFWDEIYLFENSLDKVNKINKNVMIKVSWFDEQMEEGYSQSFDKKKLISLSAFSSEYVFLKTILLHFIFDIFFIRLQIRRGDWHIWFIFVRVII